MVFAGTSLNIKVAIQDVGQAGWKDVHVVRLSTTLSADEVVAYVSSVTSTSTAEALRDPQCSALLTRWFSPVRPAFAAMFAVKLGANTGQVLVDVNEVVAATNGAVDTIIDHVVAVAQLREWSDLHVELLKEVAMLLLTTTEAVPCDPPHSSNAAGRLLLAAHGDTRW